MRRKYRLEGLDCAACAAAIEADFRKLPGNEELAVSFATQSVVLDDVSEAAAVAVLSANHPDIVLAPAGPQAARKAGPTPAAARAAAAGSAAMWLAAAMLATGWAASRSSASSWQAVALAAYLLAYAMVGLPVLKRAALKLTRGSALDENFLMAVATIGAFALGRRAEGVSVMLFYAVGEFFQGLAVRRSRKAISSLMGLRPDVAHVVAPVGISDSDPQQVEVGQLVVIYPWERVPLDGDVEDGESVVDNSALTGESVPVLVAPGDAVLAGTANGAGALRVRVSRPYGKSAVARLMELVEDAASSKARTESFITTFARYYTPAVVGGAALVALVPPLVMHASFADWAYRALILLVISCPCALVLSIPLTYFAGLGGASRRGILVKGANHIDTLARLSAVLWDKTGTLTRGTFAVTRVAAAEPFSADDTLRLAAAVEVNSSHPAGRAIVAHAARLGLAVPGIGLAEERRGQGILAEVEGKQVVAGSAQLLAAVGVEEATGFTLPAPPPEATIVHVAAGGAHIGWIAIADELRPGAADAISRLNAVGVSRVQMLTGDSAGPAAAIAAAVGIRDFAHSLMPADKVDALEREQARGSGPVAFVGDGVNDAPALARADVGIAMGGLGSDIAMEAADIVIMDDDLGKVAEAVSIARKTRSILWANIGIVLGVKSVFIVLALVGVATAWEAVISDVGVALVAVLNASRALGATPRGDRTFRAELASGEDSAAASRS